ncbi:MAG: PTS system mannose/fructose/sorbose family transporter subunit IID, partial [Elusimicrobia bacterium]|nr:PTS system mannose/fructose/sorbose family transporter subunit IID [Elusimicrobiota bacterium]
HGMQNIGFLFCLDGWLTERLKLDGAELKEARSRHLEFFNTHPVMSGMVLGVTCAFEENRKAPQAIKRALSSSLAAIGDRAFGSILRPLGAAISLSLCALASGWPLPCLAWLLGTSYLCLYNWPALRIRWNGIAMGYGLQEKIVTTLSEKGWQRKMELARRFGFAVSILLVMGFAWMTRRGDFAKPLFFVAALFVLKRYYWSAARIHAAAIMVAILLGLGGYF